MENWESKTDMSKAFGEVSEALFELRDALVELSLSLKDWQFENDVGKRKNTQDTVQKLLEQIMSARDRSS